MTTCIPTSIKGIIKKVSRIKHDELTCYYTPDHMTLLQQFILQVMNVKYADFMVVDIDLPEIVVKVAVGIYISRPALIEFLNYPIKFESIHNARAVQPFDIHSIFVKPRMSKCLKFDGNKKYAIDLTASHFVQSDEKLLKILVLTRLYIVALHFKGHLDEKTWEYFEHKDPLNYTVSEENPVFENEVEAEDDDDDDYRVEYKRDYGGNLYMKRIRTNKNGEDEEYDTEIDEELYPHDNKGPITADYILGNNNNTFEGTKDIGTPIRYEIVNDEIKELDDTDDTDDTDDDDTEDETLKIIKVNRNKPRQIKQEVLDDEEVTDIIEKPKTKTKKTKKKKKVSKKKH